jgi:dihydropteroate synthase
MSDPASGHILLLTGKLAEKGLRRIMAGIAPTEFTYEIRVMGVQVAALLTGDLIARRLAGGGAGDGLGGATRVLLPGRCRGDLDALSARLGVRFERGPEELKDLPVFFGRARQAVDLSRHDLTLFAEIVDAPQLSIPAILARAERYRADGADVIDLGCLPDCPFPHLAEAVTALKAAGLRVSVDSLRPEDLLTGGRAGADYLLSLKEDTLWIADEVAATPILIPATPGDLPSLTRAIDTLRARGRAFLADPVLDPIHYGFTESLCRYHALRARYPDIEIMMGTGNLTELTHVDTAGVNAMLLGICSELRIRAILTTEVSPHCRAVVREMDRLRRMVFAAHTEGALPKHLDDGLMALHECRPFPNTPEEVGELAAQVKDPSYRIQVTEQGISLYNRDGLHTALDPYDLYPHIAVGGDVGHAFYLGLELGRAEIAWQLGKRYTQDEPLAWGPAHVAPPVALDRPSPGRTTQPGHRLAGRGGKGQSQDPAPDPGSPPGDPTSQGLGSPPVDPTRQDLGYPPGDTISQSPEPTTPPNPPGHRLTTGRRS